MTGSPDQDLDRHGEDGHPPRLARHDTRPGSAARGDRSVRRSGDRGVPRLDRADHLPLRPGPSQLLRTTRPVARRRGDRFGQETEQALFDFVAGGKGLIAYHPTLAGGVGWDPEYERLLGGVMREETSRRAPNNDFMLHVAEPHPITDGLAGGVPALRRRPLRRSEWPEGVAKTILLTGWDNPLRYTQVPSQWRALPGMGEEHPVAWAVEYGAGRSVSIGIGHGVKAIGHPAFRALLPAQRRVGRDR